MNNDIITNPSLLKAYFTPDMELYYLKKLSNENKESLQMKIGELLKFLVMSHHTFGNIPFTVEIDELWHLWILQTVQYKELMDKLPKKKFIHHCSNDYPTRENNTEESSEVELNRQVSFLTSYVANFGGFTLETVSCWPTAMMLMQVFEFDVDQLNRYLRELAVTL